VVEGILPVSVAPDRRSGLGYAMVLASALLFAINGTVSKVMLRNGMSPVDLTELRSAGAFVGLLAFVLATRPKTLRIPRREIPLIAFYGVVGFTAVQWLYLVAIQRLHVGIALLVEFTAPLLVALWARFVVKEPVRPRVWLALDGVGLTAASVAAFVLALYFVMGERMVSTRDPISLACLAFGFASVLWAILHPWWDFPFFRLGRQVSLLGNYESTTAPMWLLGIALVVIGTLLPYTLSIASLRHLRARQVGMVGMIEPVAATLIAYVWLAESLGPVQLVGGAIVLIGVVLAETARA
jgi:drug/metabolite transporter (DMT)-like permease